MSGSMGVRRSGTNHRVNCLFTVIKPAAYTDLRRGLPAHIADLKSRPISRHKYMPPGRSAFATGAVCVLSCLPRGGRGGGVFLQTRVPAPGTAQPEWETVPMIAKLQKTFRPRVPRWHAGYLAMLPAIAAHARIAFRHRGPEACEDAVAECIAGALVAYVPLYELGKIDLAYPGVLARYAAAQVRAGRKVGSHLATYRGIFVGDACGANARLQQRSDGRIIHASCNAHARREFVKAESNDPILASQAISCYRQLYDVEERGKTLDATARWQLRQRDAVPIWNRMRRWLDSDAVKRVPSQRDRRSDRLPAKPVVGADAVPERRSDPD